jgi:hypothetical protein
MENAQEMEFTAAALTNISVLDIMILGVFALTEESAVHSTASAGVLPTHTPTVDAVACVPNPWPASVKLIPAVCGIFCTMRDEGLGWSVVNIHVELPCSPATAVATTLSRLKGNRTLDRDVALQCNELSEIQTVSGMAEKPRCTHEDEWPVSAPNPCPTTVTTMAPLCARLERTVVDTAVPAAENAEDKEPITCSTEAVRPLCRANVAGLRQRTDESDNHDMLSQALPPERPEKELRSTVPSCEPANVTRTPLVVGPFVMRASLMLMST